MSISTAAWKDGTSYQDGEAITCVAWSPDGNSIAVAGYGNVIEVWSMLGQCCTVYRGHTGVVTSVAWSPDGTFLASGSWDGTVHVWQALSGALEYTFGKHRATSPSARVTCVAWSPDGVYLASAATDWTIRVWKASRGWPVHVLSDHQGSVETISWSSNSRHLASGGQDGVLRIWEAVLPLPSPLLCEQMPHGREITAVSWSQSSDVLAVLEAGRWVHLLHPVERRWVWSGTHTALGYDEELGVSGHSVGDITFSSDGASVISTGECGVPLRWDVKNGNVLEEFHSSQSVRTIACSPFSSSESEAYSQAHLLAGSWEGALHLWTLYRS